MPAPLKDFFIVEHSYFGFGSTGKLGTIEIYSKSPVVFPSFGITPVADDRNSEVEECTKEKLLPFPSGSQTALTSCQGVASFDFPAVAANVVGRHT
ncbi:hypothetical protein [Salininema proteolyticum]|uniref:Uncharacterized protein n=1 Tax=Salininema proteolyticum TaxID=1607685 RepID=A0ABV8TZN8_9ACTN